MRWAPQPGLLRGAGACMPYWVTGVERLVLERSARLVYTDHSNFGRAIAVERRRSRGPEPLRYLMSLALSPPLPANTSVAQLEMVALLLSGHSHAGLRPGVLALPASVDPALAAWVNRSAHPAVARAVARLGAQNDPEQRPECAVPPPSWPALASLLHPSLGLDEPRPATCDEV